MKNFIFKRFVSLLVCFLLGLSLVYIFGGFNWILNGCADTETKKIIPVPQTFADEKRASKELITGQSYQRLIELLRNDARKRCRNRQCDLETFTYNVDGFIYKGTVDKFLPRMTFTKQFLDKEFFSVTYTGDHPDFGTVIEEIPSPSTDGIDYSQTELSSAVSESVSDLLDYLRKDPKTR